MTELELPLLDWDTSVALADGDAELAKDILKLTKQALPQDLAEISLAFERSDERELRRLLHKLEGGLSYAKFPRLEAITLSLHFSVKDLGGEDAPRFYKELMLTASLTLTAIEAKLALVDDQ